MDLFGKMLGDYCHALDIQSLPYDRQLQTLNTAILEVGKYVRNHLITHLADSTESILLVTGSISRAIWAQDCKLTKVLLRKLRLEFSAHLRKEIA